MAQKMRLSDQLKKPIFAIILMITVGAIIIFVGKQQRSSMKTKILAAPEIVTGIVIEVSYAYKTGYIVKYKFKLSDREFISETGGSRYAKINGIISNRTFPVIYNTKHPEFNEMLILPEDFVQYGLKFPDSLDWINH